jgi:predicted lipoprotein with Yx(FWY)xxD motif
MRASLVDGLALVVIAACGSSQAAAQPSSPPSATAATAATTPAPTATPSAAPPPTITVAGSRYGQILVDAAGRTLYLFDAETGPQPRCYDACAKAWPPFLTAGDPVAGPSLMPDRLGTATRRDGSQQLTYGGHPLYYYEGDHAPGEILCQAVIEYGGGWYVVDPQGNKITRS